MIESILGRLVFDRHGRGVWLTDTGGRLVPVARHGIAAGVLDLSGPSTDLMPLRDQPGLGRLVPSKLVLEMASGADSPQADAIVCFYSQPPVRRAFGRAAASRSRIAATGRSVMVCPLV